MSNKYESYKRTESRGSARVILHLPIEHPVVKGLFEAEKMLGGTFPDHVGEILVLPKLVPSPDEANTVTCGICFSRYNKPSKIEIYAGSIMAYATTCGDNAIDTACEVALHEIRHSAQKLDFEKGIGGSEEWYEDDAERFVVQTKLSYGRNVNSGSPRRTIGRRLQNNREKSILDKS